MPSLQLLSEPPTAAELLAFPVSASARWRREFMQCHDYEAALTLAFRLIREIEKAEAAAPHIVAEESHQLAFPWARAD